MALPTFNPPIAPSPGIGRKVKYNILEAEFGEGYSQPTRAGINHRRRELTLAWEVLTDSQAWAISDFLDERGGDLSFYYTPPRESAPVKWSCREWDDTVNTDGTRKITATFVQSNTHEV
ncbi:minor tail protein M [Rhizobium phage RHph_N1_15]|nr:minor tail protein M [Rhizobium phage RHph_N1_10]QIG69254.1 minor tail protein M [Rhizobium phage RHph_N1_15]QIG75114.1 minor tail protein M [Rhizobium phage RHph_N2_6]